MEDLGSILKMILTQLQAGAVEITEVLQSSNQKL
jgi:hypothetical protein